MHVETRIGIDVRPAEEVSHIGNIEVGLLFHLARNALLGCFVHVAEAAGKVVRAFGGLLLAYNDKQLIVFAQDKSRSGCAWIEVINKAAIGTVLAFGIVDIEITAATRRAMGEMI